MRRTIWLLLPRSTPLGSRGGRRIGAVVGWSSTVIEPKYGSITKAEAVEEDGLGPIAAPMGAGASGPLEFQETFSPPR